MKFIITSYEQEYWTYTHEVEAESIEDAEEKFYAGEAEQTSKEWESAEIISIETVEK